MTSNLLMLLTISGGCKVYDECIHLARTRHALSLQGEYTIYLKTITLRTILPMPLLFTQTLPFAQYSGHLVEGIPQTHSRLVVSVPRFPALDNGQDSR